MKVFDYIVDKYLANPIISDFAIAVIVWYISMYFSIFNFELFDKSNQINVLSNLISTNVSLAGFILAALTIIVTFKSNLKSKGLEESSNALELLFSSKHYDSIVSIFKKSLLEFVLCFILLYLVYSFSDNLCIETLNRVNVIGIIITSLSILRSLFVLFKILDLEKYKRNN